MNKRMLQGLSVYQWILQVSDIESGVIACTDKTLKITVEVLDPKDRGVKTNFVVYDESGEVDYSDYKELHLDGKK